MGAMKEFPMSVTALGGSIGGEIKSKVIVANNKRSLDSLGERGELEGKVVLLNRPFEENFIEACSRHFCLFVDLRFQRRVFGKLLCY